MLALLLAAALGADGVEYHGALQLDVRFGIPEAEGPTPFYQSPPPVRDIARDQLRFDNTLHARSGRFRGVAEVDLVMLGFPQPQTLEDLSQRRQLEPYWLESDALYIEARDLGAPGIDLRLGQQLVQFGVGDQFNPTNSVNADDIEDVLLFGDQQGNVMARLDLTPGFAMNWTVTAVVVPVFKPALLPGSAGLALADTSRLPFLEDPLRWRVHAEQASALNSFGTPTQVDTVLVQLPEPSVDNVQTFFRLGGLVGGQDLAVSYYRGFSDIPQPIATHTTQRVGPVCAPDDPEDCIQGTLQNTVTLGFPRVQVVGLNAAGEANPLGWLHTSVQPLGYRAEFAWVRPTRLPIALTQDEISFLGIVTEAGEYDYGLADDARPTVIDDRGYPQWVLGLDYTFGPHVYANAQWVHGMLDDIGAGDRLFQPGRASRGGGVRSDTLGTLGCALAKDGRACAWEWLRPRQSELLVLGMDINFAASAGLFRLFTILDLTGIDREAYDAASDTRVSTSYGAFSRQGWSQVVLPQLSWNFGDGLILEGGALLQLGADATKFGAPETGGSFYWGRARYAF